MPLARALSRWDENYMEWVMALEDRGGLLAAYERARAVSAVLGLLSSPLLVVFMLWEGSDLVLALLMLPPALTAFFFAYFNRTVRVLKLAERLAPGRV